MRRRRGLRRFLRQQFRWWRLTWAAAAVATGGPARAEDPPCGLRADLLRALATEAGEALRVQMIDVAGHLVEIVVGLDGSWTLLVTLPGGPSCIAGWGEGFRLAAPFGALSNPS